LQMSEDRKHFPLIRKKKKQNSFHKMRTLITLAVTREKKSNVQLNSENIECLERKPRRVIY